MPVRGPGPPPPPGGAGPNSSNQKRSPGSSPPPAQAPTLPQLGSLAGDDEDEPRPQPKPVRLTGVGRAPSISDMPSQRLPPVPSGRIPATVPAVPPGRGNAPPQKPAPAPPPRQAAPAPPPRQAAPPPRPAPAVPSFEPGGGATMMLEPEQIVGSQIIAPPPASVANQSPIGESTVLFDPGIAAAQAMGYQQPATQPAYAANPEATRMLDVPVRSSLEMPIVANNEATRMFDIPVRPSGVHAQIAPNSESTRIIDNINVADLLAGLAKPASGGDSSDSAEKTTYGADGKANRKKPVAEVKAKSKAKVTPIDPGRLLVQQEAAEQRKVEATMMGSLDKFLEKSGMMKVGNGLGNDEPLAGEGTMVGKFLDFVGIGGSLSPAGASTPMVGKDPFDEALEAVQGAPMLNGLNPQFLKDAIKAGDITLLSFGRDMLVDMTGKAVLVIEGQIALARFKPDVLDRERRAQAAFKAGDKKGEKREMKRRQEAGPLIRMCDTNLGLFTEGDLVSIEAQGQDLVGLAVYSVTPIRALSLSLPRLDQFRRTYQFFGDRLRRAADAARHRLAINTGARSLVADFFVRHGLSVSMSLRVRELDKCIECYECEKACEQRYGVKRLSLNGKVLGALDFVDCCHTCVDQRCIDPCAYDAIKFDDEKKEVVILEEACIGCSLCALACPYDAIEMHELEEKPLLNIRLQKEDKLAFGDGKPRKAKLRRIASKCDHCVSYEDQACISACPTSALLEIPPEAAFTERTDSMAEAAKKGFERTVMFDANQIFDPKKFYKGISEEDDKAKKKEQKFKAGWLWAIGLLGFLGCLAEIVLRKFWPDLSLLFYLQMREPGMDADMALANVEFRVGAPFALWLGYVGTVVMFSSMFYSAHKWIPGIKKLGSKAAWFDYHIWAGTIGPMLIGLHTAGKLDNWVSLAIYAMLATVISGVVGRYLSTELPDLASQASLQVMEYERKLGDMRNRHAGVNVADRFYEKLKRYYGRVADPKMSGVRAGWTSLWMLFRDSVARPFRASLLRYRLRGIKDPKARTKVAFVATELALFERRRVLYPKIEPMFREWKIVHIPFAIALTLLSSIHIVIELLRS